MKDQVYSIRSNQYSRKPKTWISKLNIYIYLSINQLIIKQSTSFQWAFRRTRRVRQSSNYNKSLVILHTSLGKTSAISTATRSWISGDKTSSYTRNARELAVESWPAIMNRILFPIISCSVEKKINEIHAFKLTARRPCQVPINEIN